MWKAIFSLFLPLTMFGHAMAGTIVFSTLTNGASSFSATVDGVSVTFDQLKTAGGTQGEFDTIIGSPGFWFGQAAGFGFDLASFEVTFSNDVQLEKYFASGSVIGNGILFDVLGVGVNSTGNLLSASQQSGASFDSGPLDLQANQAYLFTVQSPQNNFAAKFGGLEFSASSSTSGTVPEPTSFSIFAIGGLLMTTASLRRRKRAVRA